MTRPLAEALAQAGRFATAWHELTGSRYGWRRFANGLVEAIQMRLRSVWLLSMPGYVAIEVTNVCNGSCLLCPVGQGRRSRPLGFMDWDRFRRVLDDITPYARFVGLYNWGDPLLHPRLYDMIEYVKARNIFTKISTNLHAFRAEDAERLVRTGLDDLAISLHGLSEESYRAYQPRHRLPAVLEKAKAIVAAKQRLGSPTPDIHLGFIVTRYNEHEVERVPEFAAALGVGYLLEETSLNLRLLPFDCYMNPRGVDEGALRQQRLALAERWLPRKDTYVNPYYQYVRTHCGTLPPASEVHFPCTSPWRQVVVCWDGDVNLCCGSYERRHSVGNVFQEPLHRIWNNARYRAARRLIRGAVRPADPPVLCADCPGMLL